MCDSLLVSSAYTPPATNGADDLTGTVQSASGLSGCTDYTGRTVTTATLDGIFDVEGACSYHPPGEEWAWGTGQLTWSDGSVSDYSGVLVAETPLRVEIRITGGLWSGATASLPMEVTGTDGSCNAGGITDVVIEGGPFVLRPAGSSGPQALSGVAQVATGDAHTCALMSGGSVKCWGSNSSGQLGNGQSGFMVESLVPVDVVGLGSVTAVSAGGAHTCALIPGGQVRCWGANTGGQLGDGSTTASSVPVPVSGLTGATAISAGTTQTCAVVTGGAVKCWGEGDLVPTPVPGITGATDVSAGYSEQISAKGPHACALMGTGEVKCWGNNAFGQLGDGSTVSSPTPVSASGIAGATDLVAGPYGSTCAVVAGDVRCWGRNNYGQLGDGTTTDRNVPVTVLDVAGATDVGLGAVHACARISDGSAMCWGNNNYGQLGNGAALPVNTPAAVSGLADAAASAVGHYHSCALGTGGTATCWGLNGSGRLGTGNEVDAASPTAVIDGY